MKEKIKHLTEIINTLSAKSNDEVEALRIKYLSKKGEISELFNEFRTVSNDQKREVGQLLNKLRDDA
ncbi:MAG: phenylalanine--tRNA ligase subunit alpha, partial [Paludibacteraceae bacterium]|nr:phenylalanine--tRNA ligase subunit alpha [Paludibacteraceae bacterium]MBP9039848.1 phenylalanine--tRNA ligase subunit alpha [Paludibacteraceae bacterium]